MDEMKKENLKHEGPKCPEEKKNQTDNQNNEVKNEANAEKEEKSRKSEEKGAEEKKKLEELGQKLAEINDKYLRLAAEFDNYRRRTAKERLDLVASASENVIKGLLPILDDFERAIQALKDSKDSDVAKQGTELIYNKIVAYLKSEGVEAINAKGSVFNTDLHEAVAQFPVTDKKQVNTVVDVAQQGYTLNGKVIRFAKVVVGI